MGWIALEGMKFYAHHGVHTEEHTVGNDYIVDIYINTDFSASAATDTINGTINYETVYLICKFEMKKQANLLENIAQRIINSLKSKFNNMQAVRIRVSKLRPPLGGIIDRAYVELEQSFIAKCPKTQANFICYKDANCWCKSLRIHPDTAKMLKLKHPECLSPQAMKPYTL